ncbi:hypothetical protein RRG08_031287 [Elysia crispata]|uniref:Uncharacterized protein n=1 Tax=Elysia crispata TaxID=231223 RepID=A0AAE1AK15_9GAST|nr:hypothetical protein RRG08_031287 [Elysia crispata]
MPEASNTASHCLAARRGRPVGTTRDVIVEQSTSIDVIAKGSQRMLSSQLPHAKVYRIKDQFLSPGVDGNQKEEDGVTLFTLQ